MARRRPAYQPRHCPIGHCAGRERAAQVPLAGLAIQVKGELAGELGVVIDRLATEIESALRRHPIFHDQVSHVGGAFFLPDESSGARFGFKRGGESS